MARPYNILQIWFDRVTLKKYGSTVYHLINTDQLCCILQIWVDRITFYKYGSTVLHFTNMDRPYNI
jgi:general stress protein CsbA